MLQARHPLLFACGVEAVSLQLTADHGGHWTAKGLRGDSRAGACGASYRGECIRLPFP